MIRWRKERQFPAKTIAELEAMSAQQAPGEDCAGRNGRCVKKCIGRVLVWDAALSNEGLSLGQPQFVCGTKQITLLPNEQVAAYRHHLTGDSRIIHGIIISSKDQPDAISRTLPATVDLSVNNANMVIARLCVEFDGQPASMPSPNAT